MIIGISGKKRHGKNLLGNIIEYIVDEYHHHGELVTPLEDWSIIKNSTYIEHYEQKSFAHKLKKCASIILGLPIEIFESEEGKNTTLGKEWDRMYWFRTNYSRVLTDNPDFAESTENITVRRFLQEFGTEVGRSIHPNTWVNSLFADYKPLNRGDIIERTGEGVEKDGTFWHIPELPSIPKEYWGKRIQSRKFVYYEKVTEDIFPNWVITDVRFPNEAKAIKDRGGLIFRINRPSIESDDTHASETALDNYTEFDEIISNDSDIDKLIHRTQSILQKYKIIQ